MWNNRSLWLNLYISKRGARPRIWLWLPIALYVPHQFLLAWEGPLALLPGRYGKWARAAIDTIHAMLLQLLAAPPLTIADINIQDGEQRLRVLARTSGLFSGGDTA